MVVVAVGDDVGVVVEVLWVVVVALLPGMVQTVWLPVPAASIFYLRWTIAIRRHMQRIKPTIQ